MGDETWASIQLVKSKRESIREKLKRRKAERDTILSVACGSGNSSPATSAAFVASSLASYGLKNATPVIQSTFSTSESSLYVAATTDSNKTVSTNFTAELEEKLLQVLSDIVVPIAIEELTQYSILHDFSNATRSSISSSVLNLLEKFACKDIISLKNGQILEIHHARVKAALIHQCSNGVSQTHLSRGSSSVAKTENFSSSNLPHTSQKNDSKLSSNLSAGVKRPRGEEHDVVNGEVSDNTSTSIAADDSDSALNKVLKTENSDVATTAAEQDDDVMSLLSAPSIRERESKRVGAEILELLNKPTAKERNMVQNFRSQGSKVWQFCPRSTVEECTKWRHASGRANWPCDKLHFRKIIQPHTDETLGDCSFLNTCFHMDTCRYVHYEVDYFGTEELPNGGASAASPGTRSHPSDGAERSSGMLSPRRCRDRPMLFPPQWIQCDLRYFDMSILGKFAVIMADPPWDIHMELPYGTMSDDEMRQLNIPALQDEGLIFLWVTGRAMELGRECLTLWGYERVDEIIWVKTNQLQRIIRTGRTGHWLNHGKEHCLVGMKGNPKINRCMDCDVIVAEVRATSHKPDEIYGIIERLSPGTRKIELFGRHHNVQPNWLTLGNQLEDVNLLEEDLIRKFKERYPDGIANK